MERSIFLTSHFTWAKIVFIFLCLFACQSESYTVVVKQGLGTHGKLFSTLSTLNIYTRLDDHGVQYSCQAEHPALMKPIKSSITLSVLCMFYSRFYYWFPLKCIFMWHQLTQYNDVSFYLRSSRNAVNRRIFWWWCDQCWRYSHIGVYQSWRESTG